jgi:hypothetical protein
VGAKGQFKGRAAGLGNGKKREVLVEIDLQRIARIVCVSIACRLC